MEKEKRKRKDTPLSPRQRYLPLVVMGGLLVITVILPISGIGWFTPYELFDDTWVQNHYWMQYVRLGATLLWMIAVIMTPLVYSVHIFRRREQYAWTWENIAFSLLVIPIFCLNSWALVWGLASTPRHITTLEYENQFYHIKYEMPDMDDFDEDFSIYLFRCDNSQSNCERNYLGYDFDEGYGGHSVQFIELVVVDTEVAVCVIDTENAAFLYYPEFEVYGYDPIWNHPVEDHPQCNTESFQ